MKKIIGNVIMTIGIVLSLYMAISYIEIISKCDKPNPQYSNYNLFVNVFRTADEWENK